MIMFAAIAAASAAFAAPMLIPAPREMSVTGGRVALAAADAPKVEVVASIPPEGYELSITTNAVTIRHSDDAGLFYAKATLAQLRADAADASLPCLEIKDAPAFRWRGLMLDESCRFFGKVTVKKLLDLMSRYKMNVFHWHLTDDQAWRLFIPEYPELVKKCGKSGSHEREVPPFYTEGDVREILAFAAARHITIVPEIDFPGHFRAVVRAYPKFACAKGARNAMCVGNPEAVRFAEMVLDRVCELFPSKVVHIGGDECKAGPWAKCPRCMSLVRRENLGGVKGIQPWLTRHLAGHLAAKGRRLCGWEEIAVGFGKPDARGESNNDSSLPDELLPPREVLVMGYHVKPGAKSANMGYDVIACPNWHCYFDYSQKLPEDPYLYFRPDIRWLPFEAAYRFDPYEGVKPEARRHITGVECCLWTSHVWSVPELEWKVWPRGLAFAEVAWSNPDPAKRDFAEFSARAAEHRRRLIREHVNCAPLK